MTTMTTMTTHIKYITTIIVVLLTLPSIADTFTVKQDSTGDYTIIQNAVDAATDGDTVLVWPGTYYENLHIDSKNLTIGSLTLTTGNLDYIKQTVINGNQTGGCFNIEDYHLLTTVNGFTLTNGSGTWHGNYSGGAIIVDYATVDIYNCLITDNMALGYGGGIYYYYSQGYLSNVTIRNNHSYGRGGGILLLNSNIEFDSINKCNIYLNYSAIGTDIYKMGNESFAMHVIVDTFTVSNPDYYYLYSNIGSGLVGDDITYDIGTGKLQSVKQDLYVAPDGNNSNTGLTSGEPLRNISFALLKMASDSLTPDTIHVRDGLYTLTTGEKYPLSIKGNICIKGQSKTNTILDAEDEIYMLHGIQYADNYCISNFTIQNGNGDKNHPYYPYGAFFIGENRDSKLSNIIFRENKGNINSCGFLSNSNGFVLEDIIFKDNIGGMALFIIHGNGHYYYSDTVTVLNCKFINNQPNYSIPPDEGGGGGGLIIGGQFDSVGLMNCYTYNSLFHDNHSRDHPYGGMSQISFLARQKSNVYATNCTFTNNTSDNHLGGNIGVTSESNLNIYNSILYNINPAEIYMYTDDGNSNLNIYNSLVMGGEDEIRLYSTGNTVYYDETNIDTNPLFYGGWEYPYNLSDNSPCIDAGTLDFPDWIELPEHDLAGNPRLHNGKIDMGAYEWNPTVGVDEYLRVINKKENLLVAAPNPFKHNTTISVKHKKKAVTSIEIYNNYGQRVKVLLDGTMLLGTSQIKWNGEDDKGKQLESGIYYVVLFEDGREVESLKVVLQN